MSRPDGPAPAPDRTRSTRSTRLTWGPVGWELTSGDPAEHRWFAAHLSVTGDHLPYAAPLRTFRIEVRTGASDEWRGPAGPVVLIRGVPHHRTVVEGHPAWVRVGDAPYAYVHRGGDDWLVLREERGADRFRAAETLAAELLNVTLAGLGGTTVHASAATAPHGTLFAGASGTGKSTLALALAARGGAFIAGDRSVLLPGEHRWHVAGAAVAARFGRGTLHATGHAGRVDAARLLRHGGTAPAPGSPKTLLTPAELHGLLGTRTSAGAPLARVALLEHATGAAPAVTRVPPDEAAHLLLPHLLPAPAPWWDDSPPPPAALAPCPPVPTFRVRWNPVVHTAGTVLRLLDGAGAPGRS
ncbi:hypothetical protein [Streptomyces acidiscabies]|uniref:hypothetical protein n=1 Tax=Streptomyces acidiscabies TaxID=42234 RepID=UPI0038F7FBD4